MLKVFGQTERRTGQNLYALIQGHKTRTHIN